MSRLMATWRCRVRAVPRLRRAARPLAIDFGMALQAGDARRIELSGRPDEVNDLANPKRVAPVEKTFRFAGGRVLKTTLAPNSLTVFRLRASL